MYDIESQKAKVKVLYPDANDAAIELQLEFAKEPIEDRYLNLQVLMTVEALSKEGAEGEKQHSDNGVSRVYENGSPYSDALMNRIIPLGTSYKS